jgi:hypothetical protein
MNDWQAQLKTNPLPWLLGPDEANPGVRYFAQRDLLDRPADDPELVAAQAQVMRTGPVPAILDAQYPDGYWIKPGPVYSPKYRGTVWQVLFLAQLGTDGQSERVRRAAEYVFEHGQAQSGAFAMNGRPSGTIYCLWGNLARALLDLGYWEDERLQRAVDALARSITGDGYEWYLKSGVQAPGFFCSANYDLPTGRGSTACPPRAARPWSRPLSRPAPAFCSATTWPVPTIPTKSASTPVGSSLATRWATSPTCCSTWRR